MNETVHGLQSVARRNFLSYFSGIGLSGTLLPGALWAGLQEQQAARVTLDMVKQAAAVSGLEFSDTEAERMVEGVNRNLSSLEEVRRTPLEMNAAPAMHFSPMVSGLRIDRQRREPRLAPVPALTRPANLEEAAFWPITHLAHLLRTRQVRSVELAEMYLARLKRYNPKLNCVVCYTEALGMEQARRADEEMAAGNYRGPLHGIPWGCKDIISVKGYTTTWGVESLQDQVIDLDASVVEQLREAGAVLIAKLSTGQLASGDRWFKGRTNNPWNPAEGSSGSSAGPASATAAGLVAFGIGTETSGSILSPSSVCGVTGLRPTFGRVSRYGAMTLSWTQDRLGPLCRTAEDCAVVFHTICRPDDRDFSVAEIPFNWDAALDARSLRVGYLQAGFDEEGKTEDWRANERRAVEQIRGLGVQLVPFEFPDFPLGVFGGLLGVESAAFFDKIPPIVTERNPAGRSRSASRFVPAVEYLQVQRLMQHMADAAAGFDIYLAPYMEMRRRGEGSGAAPAGAGAAAGPAGGAAGGGGRSSVASTHFRMANVSGWPGVALPTGFTGEGLPTCITIMGKPYTEATILALARAYQEAAGWHLKRPNLDA